MMPRAVPRTVYIALLSARCVPRLPDAPLFYYATRHIYALCITQRARCCAL